jgi:hypothetical protein
VTSARWPEGKSFAFTVFDDPDGDTLSARRYVYPLLSDLGFRTTKSVWPIGPLREANSPGETCSSKEYREDAQALQAQGFEIAYHNAAPHSCTRPEIIESLEAFRNYFGGYPSAMANHYNADAIYWGEARLTGAVQRGIYNAVTRGGNRDRFSGHEQNSQYFWGDICREKIRYCRNLVYRNINTLQMCPWMPYHDPRRPYVAAWFSASEGAQGPAFLQALSEADQDRLEAEGGLCIMYTHFGNGFVENNEVHPEFSRLMRRLSRKNGWFAPVSAILDFLRGRNGVHPLTPRQRNGMEWRWLASKCFHGTS